LVNEKRRNYLKKDRVLHPSIFVAISPSQEFSSGFANLRLHFTSPCGSLLHHLHHCSKSLSIYENHFSFYFLWDSIKAFISETGPGLVLLRPKSDQTRVDPDRIGAWSLSLSLSLSYLLGGATQRPDPNSPTWFSELNIPLLHWVGSSPTFIAQFNFLPLIYRRF
jgi:hypothetical protein